MSSTTYEFSARGKPGSERPQLLSGWSLAGFAVLVLIPLAMMFPKQELLRQASQQRLGDPLTISYLTNLLRAEPDNLELRLLLAEHKIYLGKLDGVAELVQPALDSSDPEWQAIGLLTEYKRLTRQLQSTPKDTPEEAALIERRRAILIKLSLKPWPMPTLVYLAGQADLMHEHGISMLLYIAISDASPSVSAYWLAEAAARAIGDREYELAAHLYFIARHKESSLSGQRKYLLAGVHALMSGALFPQAMQAIDKHLGNLENDEETLYELVKSARAADDQPRAVRYAKRLLHMSWLDGVLSWLQTIDLGFIGIANASAEPGPEAAGGQIRPYVKKDYQLAYDVFMGNNKLDEAYRVAEAAVRQSPSEVVWHKRLVQLAEWTGKLEVALREWRWLARHGGGKEALLAVLRLAPVLDDYDALLDAWKQMGAEQKLDDKQLENLSSLFEQTAHQREGIKYFEGRYAVEHRPLQLEIAARLAERNGEDEHANALYFRLLKQHGIKPDWVMKIANSYLRKGEYQQAYDLLNKYRGQVGEKDVAYWKLTADLAWQLQRDTDARKEYRRLKEAGSLAREDFGRLFYLLDDKKQEEKAALAEQGFRRFGDRDMLLRALEIYAARKDLVAQRRLFEQVVARSDVNMSDSSRFYLLRAQYLQASGDPAAARADLRHAVAIAPGDPNTVNALLWFMIDAHDREALREMVARITARGDQEKPEYWGTLAAAYQVLDQPSRAVAYYTRQLGKGGQDFLWLVNYADALEQDRQPGMADRVRQHAWRQLKVHLSGKPLQLPFSQDMLAAARLATLNSPGDASLNLVRSVLRQDRLLKPDVALDDTTSELVLGWAISTEQSANAKAWLWRRYGQSLSRPLWADASVALTENDTVHLDRLFNDQAEGMSAPVRHDAAMALGRSAEAESIAFDGLNDDPESGELNRRFAEDVQAAASFADFELQHAQIGSLHYMRQRTQVEMPAGHGMRIAAEFWRTRQSDDAASGFAPVPGAERVSGIMLKNHGNLGDSEIAVRRRNEYAGTTEWRLGHDMNVAPRVGLQLDAEFHAAADESNDLQEFGMRNQVKAGVSYTFGRREYLHVEPAWARYYLQTGNALGSGHHVSWELGHRFRDGYPDMKISVIGLHTRFSTANVAPLPLPPDSNIYGLCGSFGESYRNGYAHAWQPYLSGCATHNDVSGEGYNAALGLAGSIMGRDRLSATLTQERGGANLVYGLSRKLSLNYRYLF